AGADALWDARRTGTGRRCRRSTRPPASPAAPLQPSGPAAGQARCHLELDQRWAAAAGIRCTRSVLRPPCPWNPRVARGLRLLRGDLPARGATLGQPVGRGAGAGGDTPPPGAVYPSGGADHGGGGRATHYRREPARGAWVAVSPSVSPSA